jgi:hypothetical protein
MVEIAHCRCARWPRRCTNRVTQEDMRCDICRDRCVLLTNGDWSAHAGVDVEVIIEPDLSRLLRPV